MNATLRIFYGIIGLGLMAYLWVICQFSFKTDIAILTNFAERMISSGKIARDYYEVNPPLSMIVYIPEIWFKNIFSIPVYYAHIAYVCVLILLSSVLSWGVLKRIPILNDRTRLLILGLFVIGNIVVPNYSFGDRDHLIALGLVPFMLAQAALHYKTDIPKVWLIPSLVFGTLAVLIKPHYGLIPTVLMLWRFWQHRDIHFYKAPDFLALAIGVIAYALVLFLVFPDFISIILPDVITLYLPYTNPAVYQELFIFCFITGVLGATALTFDIPKNHKTLITWLTVVTFLLFIPYLVQGKGFDYHRIPWMLSFAIFLGTIIYALCARIARKGLSVMLSTAIMVAVIWAIRPLPFDRPTHDEFQNLPLSRVLEQQCPDPCSFLLLNDTSELIHQLAIYHEAEHASRFTSMWYLLPLIQHEQSLREGGEGAMPEEEYKALKDKYVGMVAEDLNRYKPDIIIELETLNVGDPEFDFIDFYSSNEEFAEAFAAYEVADRRVLDLSLYFSGLSTKYLDRLKASEFTIYRRR